MKLRWVKRDSGDKDYVLTRNDEDLPIWIVTCHEWPFGYDLHARYAGQQIADYYAELPPAKKAGLAMAREEYSR
jgi:hypothetical protein